MPGARRALPIWVQRRPEDVAGICAAETRCIDAVSFALIRRPESTSSLRTHPGTWSKWRGFGASRRSRTEARWRVLCPHLTAHCRSAW